MDRNESVFASLKRVRVIDFTHAWAGPICTMLLGDMGADVVKVEPISGAFMRDAMDGAFYITANRNKRSIALNLKSNEGKAIALKLLEKADVAVENFVPGVMDKLGLGYEVINKLNPSIIYCSISGYGQKGPYSQRPSFDPTAQAVSGVMLVLGESNRPPVRIPPAMIDYGAGIHAAYGIVISLLHRCKTGKGQHIDVSLMDVGIAQMSLYVTHYTMTGETPQRMGSGHRAYAPYQAFETKDGWVMICISNDQTWTSFCKALNLDNLLRDPRFATIELRLKYRKKVIKAVSDAVRQYRAKELETILSDAGIPSGMLRSVAEIIEDNHVLQRHIIEDMAYPKIGKFKTVRTPIFFNGEAIGARLKPPQVGEHTAEVLTELGYSAPDIKHLEDGGVVREMKNCRAETDGK
jgi:crotonobetainyl-CoA:carnitine CoA-transferase CaiB-like acyl-CoA transferase